MNRNEARHHIVNTANRHRIRLGYSPLGTIAPKGYSMRRIQQAVCVVRRRFLVDPEVLIAAGYSTEAR